MPPRKSLALKPRGPPRTPPELRSMKASISTHAVPRLRRSIFGDYTDW